MEQGSLPVIEFAGGFDLQSTVESGQTFAWTREDNTTYESTGLYGGDSWYYTVHDTDFVRVRQHDGYLEWEATTDATTIITERFRLHDDLPGIIDTTPDDLNLMAAYDTYHGMRITNDPFFQCLIAFICSAQMHVKRIHDLQQALARSYGTAVTVNGQSYHAFPTPKQLAATTEQDLRDLGLGYRAPYVQQSAELIATGELTPGDIPQEYEQARSQLTGFVGVGEKVADCVCLFSLGFLGAVPLDTWIKKAIDRYYPECNRRSYAETSKAIRDRFGPFAGYAQTYLFHYIRHRF